MYPKCPRCGKKREIPQWLKVCFKCAYPKHDRYFWEDAKIGDKVFISGNVSRGSVLIPRAYGPHTVHNTTMRTLISGSNGREFNHPEDSLLCLKENEDG